MGDTRKAGIGRRAAGTRCGRKSGLPRLEKLGCRLCKRENIIDFGHFAQKLRENDSENVVFKNKNGYQMVINHKEAVASESSILSQYRIPAAYSQGLFD